MSADGIRNLLCDLRKAMLTTKYAEMLEVSAKMTQEVAELKWKRDNASKALRRGRRESQQHSDTKLARQYKAGVLQEELAAAEAAFGARKQKGIASLLPNA